MLNWGGAQSLLWQLWSFSFLPFPVFKELLTRLSEEKRNGAPHLPKIGDIKKASRYSIPDLAVDVEQVIGLEKVNKKSKANTVGGRNKLKKILDKTRISILPQKPYKWVLYFLLNICLYNLLFWNNLWWTLKFVIILCC